MSNKTLEGMARAGWASGNPVLRNHPECFPETEATEIEKMRHALLWLADNVSDAMVEVFNKTNIVRNINEPDWEFQFRKTTGKISATLRAVTTSTEE